MDHGSSEKMGVHLAKFMVEAVLLYCIHSLVALVEEKGLSLLVLST